MPKALDLTGQKFGRLTAIEFLGKIKLERYWHVKCECGNEELVSVGNLRTGKTKSCGCLQKEVAKEQCRENFLKHGGCRNFEVTPENNAWRKLRQNSEFVPEWNDFQKFFQDVGWRPSPQHELRRHDVREPHGPLNTYWRDPIEQQQRRNLTTEDLGNECFFDMRTFCLAA